MRAVGQLFCGIPHQSPDNFVHKHTDLRVGAAAPRPLGGRRWSWSAARGEEHLCSGPAASRIDEADARLARLLGGVAPEEFLKKFVIDHAELVAGGRAVVDGGGDLGRVLFAAGSGLAGLGAVQKRLDDEAEALFKRGGSKPLINLNLAELEAARKKVKDDTLRSSEYLAHDEALRRPGPPRRAGARARRGGPRAGPPPEPRRRPRTDRPALGPSWGSWRPWPTRPALGRFHLPPPRRRVADRAQRAVRLRGVAAKARELAEARELLDVPEPLLEQADAITEIHLRLGVHRKGRQEHHRLEAEHARLEAEARSILRKLGRDPGPDGPLAPDGLDALRLKAADRAAVLDLANDARRCYKPVTTPRSPSGPSTRRPRPPPPGSTPSAPARRRPAPQGRQAGPEARATSMPPSTASARPWPARPVGPTSP